MKKNWIIFLGLFFSLSITTSFAQLKPDLSLYGATISPTPSIFPGGVDTYVFRLANVGFVNTSNPNVKVKMDLSGLDFPGGIFNSAYITQTMGSTPFLYTYDSSIKQLTFTLNGTFTSLMVNEFTITNLEVTHFSDTATADIGANVYADAPASDNLKTTNDTTNTYTFTIADPTLPIQLINFDVTSDDCNNVLKWNTAIEEGTTKFDIQRSSDSRIFETISSINSTGNYSDYSYIDKDVDNGIYFYRLKMIEENSKIQYSNIKSSEVNCDVSYLSIYPNPVTDILHINGLANNDVIIVYDVLGKQVLKINNNQYSNQIDVSELANATYQIAVIRNGTKLFVKQFTKI